MYKLIISTILLSILGLGITQFDRHNINIESNSKKGHVINKLRQYDQPDEAALWLAGLRQTSNKSVSPAQLNNSIKSRIIQTEKAQKMNKSSAVDNLPLLKFENLGPSNFGGRIRGFVINSNNNGKLLAGGVIGGVFKSDNGGQSWYPNTDFLPTLAIGSMINDPDDSERVFIGTGEGFFNSDSSRGAGIFVSSDFGDSWQQLAATNNENFYYVNRLVRVPNSDVLIAATSKGIFRSDNLGESWQETSQYITNGRGFVDLKIDPSNGSHLLANHYGFANDALVVNVISPNSIAASYDAIAAGFGPEFDTNGTGDKEIVLVTDGTAPSNDGCETISTDLTGKIALAQRGSCNFTVKVKNAQLAGAVAVIIYQNSGDAAFTMGGSDETITIPSAMISKSDGELIANASSTIMGNVKPEIKSELSRFIMQSTDAGITWHILDDSNGLPVSNVGRMELAFGSDGVIYVSVANSSDATRGLWRSSGLNSNFVKTASNEQYIERQGWYDLAIAVHPNDSDTVFMGAVDQYVTHDAGVTITRNSTWAPGIDAVQLKVNKYIHADQHGYFFSPSDPNQHYIVSDGGVFKTENNGQTFFSVNDGLSLSQSYGIAISPDGSKITSGTQDNGSQIYFGDSNSWIEWHGGDGGYSAWDQQDSKYLYGSTPNGAMFGSNDGGANTTEIALPDTDGAQFIQPFALDPNNGNRMIIGTDNIFYSENIRMLDNATFTDISGSMPSGSVNALTFNQVISDQVLFGMRNGTVFKINNVATTNNVTNISPLGLGAITDIKVDAADSSGNTIYLTRANYDVDRVLLSSNGGTSWQSISGDLPDIPVFQISIDPSNSNRVFIGTELGLWVALVNGDNTHWLRYDYGLAFTRVLDLIWSDENTLFIGTHGRGTYKASRDAIEISLDKFVTTSSTNDNDGILDLGESGLLMVRLKNQTGVNISNVEFNLDSNDISLSNNTSINVANIPANSSVVIPVEASLPTNSVCVNESKATASVNYSGLNTQKQLQILTSANRTNLSNDFSVDADDEGTSKMSFDLMLGQSNWQIVSDTANTGTNSWFTTDENNYSDKSLTSPWLVLNGGGNVLTFALKYSTEGDASQYWDGAVLEIREKGGLWTDIGNLSTIPYDGQLFTNNTIQGRFAWSGIQDTWRNAVVDLAETYKGKTMQFRFRMTSDTGQGGVGFWVDDIKLSHVVQNSNPVCDDLISTDSKIPFSGLWYDRAHNGHGFVIEPTGNNQYFTIFYTYDDLGNPEWYTSQSTLENGVLNLNFDQNTLLKFLYDFSIDPTIDQANSMDPSLMDGRLSIDFNSESVFNSAACQDGEVRNQTLVAVARWKINDQESSWCIEPIIGESFKGFPDISGAWYAGVNDSGWGFSIAQTQNQLVAIIFYYDQSGISRWLIGQQDDFKIGTELSIQMNQVSGYGRTETPIQPVQVNAGVLNVNIQNSLNNIQIDGNIRLDVEYLGIEGGSWIRNDVPISILTKPH